MEIIETSKKKPSVIYEGHHYRHYRINKENVITWNCMKEKSHNCTGKLKSKDGNILLVTDHSCKPDIAAMEVKKYVSNAKKRLREFNEPSTKVYHEEIIPLVRRGYEFVTQVPTYTSMKRTLNRIKKLSHGESLEYASADDIVLPEELTMMQDGTNFLLEDNADEGRNLIFASAKGKEVMKTSQVFFADGTFKSCPKQFSQLYTIHADIGSTDTEINIIPVAFALVINKTRKTYEKLFTILKTKGYWNPIAITIDFEAAVITALRNIFPLTSIKGCNFHYNQCLWRKIQDLGLVVPYKSDAEIRLHLRMCSSLAYLPEEDVSEGWLYIQSKSPEDSNLIKFYDYYVDQWLENESIPISMWNCNERVHRTNNAVEGWNSKLNSVVSKAHPSINELIKCLKNEATYSDFLEEKIQLNFKGKKRSKVYINLNQHIERTLAQYKVTGNIQKCLETLAHVAKFD